MKIAFMYSGQGAQEPGMMRDIHDRYADSKKVFDTADNVLGRSISEISFSGTAEDLALTHNTQPCVLAADLAAGVALEAEEIHPDVVAGFSLGEYGALVRAGVFSIEDAFKIIQVRADAMQEAVPVGKGAMAAIIGPSAQEVEALCDEIKEYVVPANYNSPVQTVVSGTVEGVDKLVAAAEEKGIKAIKLNVSAPFHCDLMKPAAEKVKQELANTELRAPKLPVYMNVNASAISNAESVAELLYKQAMSAVRWQQTLLNMKQDGVDIFIECGPGKTLWGLARKTLGRDVQILRVADIDTLNKTLEKLKG